MPVPSASSKSIFPEFKFFWACSIFFEHSQIFWSWSKARFYLINLHIWAWSKIFEHIQKILNTVKNIWTWSKNIWTSKWIRHNFFRATFFVFYAPLNSQMGHAKPPVENKCAQVIKFFLSLIANIFHRFMSYYMKAAYPEDMKTENTEATKTCIILLVLSTP